jgi:hypothetical protein
MTERSKMNTTAGQTLITVNTTTTTKRASAIKKVTVYDYRGKARQIEKLRGIQI